MGCWLFFGVKGNGVLIFVFSFILFRLSVFRNEVGGIPLLHARLYL